MPSDYSRDSATRASQNERKVHVRAAQIRLLYDNANTGIAVTILAAPALAYFQSFVIPHRILLIWLAYMLLVSAGRFLLSRRYRATLPGTRRNSSMGSRLRDRRGTRRSRMGSCRHPPLPGRRDPESNVSGVRTRRA